MLTVFLKPDEKI